MPGARAPIAPPERAEPPPTHRVPIDHPLRSPLAVSQGTSVEDAASFLNEQHGLPTVGALRALRHASGDPHEAPLNALGRRLLRTLRRRRRRSEPFLTNLKDAIVAECDRTPHAARYNAAAPAAATCPGYVHRSGEHGMGHYPDGAETPASTATERRHHRHHRHHQHRRHRKHRDGAETPADAEAGRGRGPVAASSSASSSGARLSPFKG